MAKIITPLSDTQVKQSNSQIISIVLKRIGFTDELVSHGLRALASTTLNKQDFDLDVI